MSKTPNLRPHTWIGIFLSQIFWLLCIINIKVDVLKINCSAFNHFKENSRPRESHVGVYREDPPWCSAEVLCLPLLFPSTQSLPWLPWVSLLLRSISGFQSPVPPVPLSQHSPGPPRSSTHLGGHHGNSVLLRSQIRRCYAPVVFILWFSARQVIISRHEINTRPFASLWANITLQISERFAQNWLGGELLFIVLQLKSYAWGNGWP